MTRGSRRLTRTHNQKTKLEKVTNNTDTVYFFVIVLHQHISIWRPGSLHQTNFSQPTRVVQKTTTELGEVFVHKDTSMAPLL